MTWKIFHWCAAAVWMAAFVLFVFFGYEPSKITIGFALLLSSVGAAFMAASE